MSIYITPHFKWSEATTTDTDLPNEPNDYARANLVQTFRILERVRQYCNFPLIINSAYRSRDVNSHPSVNGNQNSYHLDGRAVDIKISHLSECQVNKLYNNLLTYAPTEIYQTKVIIHVAF